MKESKQYIAQNLTRLRQKLRYSQEQVGERIGVSRQTVAKWEAGETVPDLMKCDALAALFDVSLDDLLHFDKAAQKADIPPKGKHLFGAVRVGERGQLVLPKRAREIFQINPGDMLVVLGDEAPERAGLALVKADHFLKTAEFYQNALRVQQDGAEEEDGR